jgi:hypothetical protein
LTTRRDRAYLPSAEADRIARQVRAELRRDLGFVPSELEAHRKARTDAPQPAQEEPLPASAPTPKRRQHQTYVITTEGSPLVKIGRALDPARRLLALQTGQPVTLTLAWTAIGLYERQLHGRFAAYRVRGEWFDLSKLGDPVSVVEAAVAEIRQSRAA